MQVAIDFLQLIAVSTGVAILIGFLVATNYLQRKALDRATDIMLCCAPQLQATRAYADAQRYFDRRTPEKVSRIVETAQNIIGAGQGPGAQSTAPAEHRSRDRLRYLPEIVLILITLVFSLVAFFGTKYSEGGVASYVLGGKAAIAPIDAAALATYESKTLFMISIAFLVAYIRTIALLVERINNNDMRPISYYFLALNMLTSILAAIVTRHLIGAFDALSGGESRPEILAVVAFAVGWKPSLWLQDLWDKVAEKLKMIFLKANPPDQKNLPLDMNLLMIQGLTGDYADRLKELGIDSCQDLAERNAVVLWLRTPFTLELVCDWISQAQLCCLYEDDKLKSLRKGGIRDICCYFKAIGSDDGIDAVVKVLGADVSPPLLKTQREALNENPAFLQLRELHNAMIPRPKPSAAPLDETRLDVTDPVATQSGTLSAADAQVFPPKPGKAP